MTNRFDVTTEWGFGAMEKSPDGEYVSYEDYAEIKAQRDALEQRAEAAEAKLAELEKQQHVAEIVSKLRGLQRVKEIAWIGGSSQPVGARLYARPAPSINLADLVPINAPIEVIENMDEVLNVLVCDSDMQAVWSVCRTAILHKIEKANK